MSNIALARAGKKVRNVSAASADQKIINFWSLASNGDVLAASDTSYVADQATKRTKKLWNDHSIFLIFAHQTGFNQEYQKEHGGDAQFILVPVQMVAGRTLHNPEALTTEAAEVIGQVTFDDRNVGRGEFHLPSGESVPVVVRDAPERDKTKRQDLYLATFHWEEVLPTRSYATPTTPVTGETSTETNDGDDIPF